MKIYENKHAVTLVEMVIVIAVIGLLVSMVVGISIRIDNQSKEKLTADTISILTAAIEQFGDYQYQYKSPDYTGLDFPLDCNDFVDAEFTQTLEKALGFAAGSIIISDGTHLNEYSGSEALYFFLNMIPECRKTLDRIDESLITNRDEDGNRMKIFVDKEYSLLRIIDPWGKTLRYDYYRSDPSTFEPYYNSKRNFPVIISAGPDRNFDTDDDITNRNM